MTPFGVISYIFHMIHQLYAIATSKLVLIDGYCIAVSALNHKRETVFIQMWHALGAIKKFGYQTIGKTSGSDARTAEIMRMHKNYDYVLCAGKATARHFCEGFNVIEDKIKYIGLPRIDYIKAVSENNCEIKKALNTGNGKKNILYAPTFRNGLPIKLKELVSAFDFNNMNLIVKLHPLDKGKVGESLNEPDDAKIIDGEAFATYDLIKYCDAVITDYSAVSLETALIFKPLYFYLYDFEEYSMDPGLNIDIEAEMGEAAAKDAANLAAVMLQDYDFSQLEAYRNKYISVDTEDCTGRLCGFLAELMED